MPTRAFISLTDHENEKSGTQIWVQDVGVSNYGSVTQDIDELKDAIDTISIGTITESGFGKSFPELGGFPSTDPQSQRETKWLITYQDVIQFLDGANTIANPGYLKIFTTEIPCADLSLLPAGQDELDITAGVGLAFCNVFNPNARSPYNNSSAAAPIAPSHFVKVLSIKHVGRNT